MSCLTASSASSGSSSPARCTVPDAPHTSSGSSKAGDRAELGDDLRGWAPARVCCCRSFVLRSLLLQDRADADQPRRLLRGNEERGDPKRHCQGDRDHDPTGGGEEDHEANEKEPLNPRVGARAADDGNRRDCGHDATHDRHRHDGRRGPGHDRMTASPGRSVSARRYVRAFRMIVSDRPLGSGCPPMRPGSGRTSLAVARGTGTSRCRAAT